MSTTKILEEAKKLHSQGFAVHWLHAKSKRPVESGWTTGPRKTWEQLEKTYSEGLNVGVRLGQPSKIKGHFLAVLDVDVKSKDEKHRKEVSERIAELQKGLTLPEVESGRGNNSRHYYILTKEPIKPAKLFQSTERVKVPMPSVQPSKRDLEALSEKEIKAGLRLRPAWEIAVMGEGQQVVLPPSIHPDSGRPYKWRTSFEPKLAASFNLKIPDKEVLQKETSKIAELAFEFEPEEVEVAWLPGISEKTRAMILTGEGVDDRSAMLLPISHALLNAGLNRNEILSVLTNPKNFIGKCAYEHAQSNNRKRAAKWVWSYSLKKVMTQNSAATMFAEPILIAEPLSVSEMAEQEREFKKLKSWKDALDRTEKGVLRGTLKNVVLILINAVSPNIFKRDSFAWRDFYGCEVPWGPNKKDQVIKDEDCVQIRYWLSKQWGIEPQVNVIDQALIYIAMKNVFDPIQEFLKTLPEWDGIDRLDTWLLKNFEAKGDPEYLAQVFRKWIVGMVMRAEKPGAHFPWMPIFEGMQGIGKSSFGRILVGEKYFLDWLPALADKDAALGLQGMWAVEMGELASLRKNEIETVKAFVTRTIDKVRPPYGERMIESPRRCVFFGTTNSTKYLQDDSGNRRFKPVVVGWLDFKVLEAEREQLFSEALWLYRAGLETEKTVELTGSAKQFEATIHREKMIKTDADLMTEILYDFFKKEEAKKDQSLFPILSFKIAQLFGEKGVKAAFTGPLHQWGFTPRNVQFASNALNRIGVKNYHTKHGNEWKWVPNE